MTDPLQQQHHQLPVLLPAQLQFLGTVKSCQGGWGLPPSCPWGKRVPSPLTLAFTPPCVSGTRGIASYKDETYVMMDFSSGWGTSTSVRE